MDTKELKQYVIKQLRHSEDDSLERAEMTFRGMSDARLDGQWGQSGRTCREILTGYREERQRSREAQAWVEGLGAN